MDARLRELCEQVIDEAFEFVLDSEDRELMAAGIVNLFEEWEEEL
jgi:hypothetical protein